MKPSSSPESRFSDRVADYVRYRPGYPEDVIRLLENEIGLSPESVVADVGSGTGISTAMFLRHGCEVFAVEPNAEMRAAAERMLADQLRFHSIPGSARATTLPDASVDVIAAAQAFHWFDPEPTRMEFDRILKPDCRVVLIWNERKLDTTPFLRDYEALLIRFGTDYEKVRHENIGLKSLAGFLRGPFTTHEFPNFQHFDFDSLKGRLLSSSYTPGPDHPEYNAMLAELRLIHDSHQTDGIITFEYLTKVHIGG